ncbi:MAG: glycosyltransferase [Solidesulfovibrio sp.]|uniref:glycosyltransferase n=1 Tax=Solidesulfovibrio sp. TaxID=2910990 RepID=UPI0031583E24
MDRVSVVVTTKNEARNIGACLASIAAQDYPREALEVIVVDNGSTDATKAIAREYTDLVFDKGPERSAQRNFGMLEVATGAYVMFLDADMILSRTVVRRCVAALAGGGHVALHIPEIVLGADFFPSVRRFERSFYDGTVIDGARIIKKDVFAAVGGFDTALTGPEDWDLDKKLKGLGSIGLLSRYDFDAVDAYVANLPPDGIPGALVAFEERSGLDTPLLFHNEAAFDLVRYLKKKTYYTGSAEAYIAKWTGKNPDDPDIRRQYGAAYRFFGVFVEQGRYRRLLSHPGKACGMYFLRFLVGVLFLARKARQARA